MVVQRQWWCGGSAVVFPQQMQTAVGGGSWQRLIPFGAALVPCITCTTPNAYIYTAQNSAAMLLTDFTLRPYFHKGPISSASFSKGPGALMAQPWPHSPWGRLREGRAPLVMLRRVPCFARATSPQRAWRVLTESA